jgi:hypothetical protein
MATRTYGRRSVAWPLRLLGWVVSITLVVLIMAATVAAFVAVGATAYYELTRTQADEIESKIQQRLPVGVSSAEVMAFLDSEGIQHGPVEASSGTDLQLLYEGVPKGTTVINGTVINDGYSVELVDVRMAFVLDANGNLERYVVYESHHQPEWLNDGIDGLID